MFEAYQVVKQIIALQTHNYRSCVVNERERESVNVNIVQVLRGWEGAEKAPIQQ